MPHQFLHGGTPVRERDAMVARFQAGEVPVFLLSLKAGGTGLNLTRADHVIHFDRWWNPAVEDQATDRAYRIGQTRPVQVHRFVTQGTIEEKIAELLARKRSLADSVLARGETALTELSNAELRDLVELRAVTRVTRRSATVTHPRLPAAARRRRRHLVEQGGAAGRSRRRPSAPPTSRPGRALARAGEVGAITVDDGSRVAAVKDGHDAYTVEVTVPVLDDADAAAFVELVARRVRPDRARCSPGSCRTRSSRRCEEAGVELLPYGGELGSACTCDAWLDPCPHALAVLTQLGWLIQEDPFVLIHLRGLSRDRVLRDLHRITTPRGTVGPGGVPGDSAPARDADEVDDLAVAEDAAARARCWRGWLPTPGGHRRVRRRREADWVGQRASVVATGRAPSSSSRRSRPGPSSLIILTAADDLLDRGLLLDLLLEEPVEQRAGVEVALGLGEAVEVADRLRDLLLVGERRLEGVEHRARPAAWGPGRRRCPGGCRGRRRGR